MDAVKQITRNPIINVCGKRTIDYLTECLAKFNRGANLVTLRTLSGSESTGVEVAHIMNEHFGVEVCPIGLKRLRINESETSSLEIPLKYEKSITKDSNIGDYSSKEGFVEFIVYSLLLDSLLNDVGKLDILDRKGKQLISVSKLNFDYECICKTPEDDKDTLNDLASAYYRCGLLLSDSWQSVAKVLSREDDAILGIDTNILHNATISEHLLSSITIIDPRKYVHTPNWLFLVIPSAAMHEIEQAANYRDTKNRLEFPGRMGFRALQEILELDQNADFSGVSMSIVGEASPMLDTRIELQGLRKDLVGDREEKKEKKQIEDVPVWLSPEYVGTRKKMSSGDTLIRDQFKSFIRELGFHKGIYFLTADKSHAALARAEGLQALYYKTPPWHAATGGLNKKIKLPKTSTEPEQFILSVPIGKLIYELAVQFGSIKITWGTEQIEIACDTNAETLDHWIHRELEFVDQRHLKKLLEVYSSVGRFALSHIVNVYNQVNKLIEEPELL